MPSSLVALALLGKFAAVVGIMIYISQRSAGEISEFGKTSRNQWIS